MYNFYKILIFVLLLFSNASYADDSAKGKLVAEGICSICHGINGIAGSAGNSALVPNLIAQNKDNRTSLNFIFVTFLAHTNVVINKMSLDNLVDLQGATTRS